MTNHNASKRRWFLTTLLSMALPLGLWLAHISLRTDGTPTAVAAEPAAPAPADVQLPPGAKIVKLEPHPVSIELKNPYDYRQLLVTAELNTGERIDATSLAKLGKANTLVKLSPRGLVRPAADGNGMLELVVAEQTLMIPVAVSGQKDKYEVNFVRDVMPTLSKMGCNAGTCHGAQQGKNGFKLSLRGYDPYFDYLALTDDLGGRRFNRSAPDQSLMLLKPSGAAPHVGGVLTQPGEPWYELLRAWIAQGVKFDANIPRVKSIDIFPKSPVLPLVGMKQQMAVVATYTDGATRDVTAEAFVESSNTEVATADKQGWISAVRRGEAVMLARYEGAYTATPLVVMGDRSGFVWKQTPENNWIDTLVYEKLRQVKLLPSELCTDAEFIRRIYLDLTGLPPLPDEVRAFLADNRPTKVKRDELIDKLIGSPDFVEHWTNKWSDLLQVNRKFLGEQGATAFRAWIRQAVADNMPYDKLVYSILTASGSNLENPPASYWKILRESGDVMENTTQLFLAIRFNCNKCHDHPFERWTQDQYYHMAAFFSQVERQQDPKYANQKLPGTNVEQGLPLVEVIKDRATGDVKHARTGAVAAPTFPYAIGGAAPADPAAKVTRREQLARWVTSKENPYFAKSYVNRMWSYLLGVGIIEPVDDIRAGNPPSNPKLLERLTNEFVAGGFDIRPIIRTICQSRVYQHSFVTNKWNEGDDLNYSHALPRRLPAEVLFDAVHRATGAASKLPGGGRAAQLLDSNVPIPGGFLDLFGKPPRESACECERSGGLMLGPILNLVNGPTIADAVKDPANRIARAVVENKDDAKIVEEVFLSILCRRPTAKELEAGVKALRAYEDEYVKIVGEQTKVMEAIAASEKRLPERQAEWEKTAKVESMWTVLEPATATSTGGATLTKQDDKSLLVSGPNPTPEKYQVTLTTKLTGITAIRLEMLPDASLPAQGPGRAPNGNFVLTQLRAVASAQGDESNAKPVAFQRATADFSQEGWPVATAIDGQSKQGWAVSPQFGKRHVAVFELKEPLGFDKGATITFTLDQEFVGKEHNLGRFRLSATTMKPPVPLEGLPEPVGNALATPADKRTDEQKAELAKYYRPLDTELAKLNQQLAKVQQAVADQQEYERRVAERQKREAALAEAQKTLPARQAEWEKTAKDLSAWTVLEPGSTKTTGGATLTKQDDNSLLAAGPNATPEKYYVTVTTKTTGITAFRLEVLPDPSLPGQGPGRAAGNFVLTQFRLAASAPGDEANAKPVVFQRALADFSQNGWPVASAIDGQSKQGWAVAPEFGKRHVAVFELKEPLGLPDGTTLTFKFDQLYTGKEHNLGRFRLSATTAKPPVQLDGLPEPILKILELPGEQRNAEQKAELAKFYRALDADLSKRTQELAAYPLPPSRRLLGAQDLAWALLNSPAFLFNH